jgi:glycosyltransferase involved in cell wall biosynthesis
MTIQPDFAFIFWTYKQREVPVGYPFPHLLVPAFKRIGKNPQVIEFQQYYGTNVYVPTNKEPFKQILAQLKTDKILLEWDYVTEISDHYALFNAKKDLYIIPHNEDLVNNKWKKEMIENSKVILGMNVYKEMWKNLFPDQISKMELIHPPTRLGQRLNKEQCKQTLNIKTKYSIICWGSYSSKKFLTVIPYLSEWKDTSLLFCGSSRGCKPEYQKIASENGVLDRVFFSKEAILEEEADTWFSASDLAVYPCPVEHGWSATVIDCIGFGKTCVTPDFPVFRELSNISGVIPTLDIKERIRTLLLDEDTREECEKKSRTYAQENSFEKYAEKVTKIMGIN